MRQGTYFSHTASSLNRSEIPNTTTTTSGRHHQYMNGTSNNNASNGQVGGNNISNTKAAQARVMECMNFWMTLPDTTAMIKNLVDDTYSRAGLSSNGSAVAASTGINNNNKGGITISSNNNNTTTATPPSLPSPARPSPRTNLVITNSNATGAAPTGKVSSNDSHSDTTIDHQHEHESMSTYPANTILSSINMINTSKSNNNANSGGADSPGINSLGSSMSEVSSGAAMARYGNGNTNDGNQSSSNNTGGNKAPKSPRTPTTTSSDPATIAGFTNNSTTSNNTSGGSANTLPLQPHHQQRHHSPTVQHVVDEMDLAHRIGAISPRQISLTHHDSNSTNSSTPVAAAAAINAGRSSGSDAPKAPATATSSLSPDHNNNNTKQPQVSSPFDKGLNASDSANTIQRSKSPDPNNLKPPAVAANNNNNSSAPAHERTLSGSANPDPTATITSATKEKSAQAKKEETARIEAAVKHQEKLQQQHSSSSLEGKIGDNSSTIKKPGDENSNNDKDTGICNNNNNNSNNVNNKGNNEDDDDAPIPKATVEDIPRFYVPTVSGNNNISKLLSFQTPTTPTSSNSTALGKTTASSNSGIGANLLFPPSTAVGTTTGLSEAQEIAIFTRIVNTLANAQQNAAGGSGAGRKVPPKSAGGRFSRPSSSHSSSSSNPNGGNGSGMTPLNAIVQITTESFGLPGVFAKIIHSKLVHYHQLQQGGINKGKESPSTNTTSVGVTPSSTSSNNNNNSSSNNNPITLQSVRNFYDNYIHGNSIERRMFEVLLGAAEVSFPTPAATTLGSTSNSTSTTPGAGGTATKKLGSSVLGSSTATSTPVTTFLTQSTVSNALAAAGPAASSSITGTRQQLIRADFAPLLQILLDHHPGLAFLKQTADFQARYLETVIIRIYFELDKHDTGRISWEEFRRSTLPAAIRKVDSNEDINLVLDYFSYEHFYVLYCRFWELDTDKDFLISKDDLMRYYPENTTNPVVAERIVAGLGRPLKSTVKGKMNFEDFVWFCICEEHKAHPRAIAYWFRVLDVDQDGIISGFEQEHFYQHTREKMRMLTTEFIVFDDVMCQVADMMSFSRRAIQPDGNPMFADCASATASSGNNNTSNNGGKDGKGNKNTVTSSRMGRPTTAAGNNNHNSTTTSNQTAGTANSNAGGAQRPRSAAPSGSAARLMSAAPTSRPVVGTDPKEERRLSTTSTALHHHNQNHEGDNSKTLSSDEHFSGTLTSPSTFPQGNNNNTNTKNLFGNNNNANSSSPYHVRAQAEKNVRLRYLHAGFTLSDFLRNPTAAHVAINMLTNVSKFLQFEQRDPFVAQYERPNAQQQQQHNNNANSLQFEGWGNNWTNTNISGPLEKTEWDRFCRAEYDRMAADDEAP